jgi:phosphohistidine swiveling domain-containing protein
LAPVGAGGRHRACLTPLFGRRPMVVTDGGTLAAHAPLVAREYGIPAVVATGDAPPPGSRRAGRHRTVAPDQWRSNDG